MQSVVPEAGKPRGSRQEGKACRFGGGWPGPVPRRDACKNTHKYDSLPSPRMETGKGVPGRFFLGLFLPPERAARAAGNMQETCGEK